MVCVMCFVIPLVLHIWHKFVQPILLLFWNPWEIKDAQGDVINTEPEVPFDCNGGVCTFVPGGKKKMADGAAPEAEIAATTNAIESSTADDTKKEN